MARPRTATASVKGSSGRAGDLEMMRVIAELYYLRDWKQPEIAELTGFSI
jgi:DNA-binding transcriptional regulator LsrR (DeoR family)